MSHRLIQIIMAGAVLAALSGCQWGAQSDRINRALPPGTQFLAAKDSLWAAAKAQPTELKALEVELQARMEQRAVGCAANIKLGLLDSDESIREKLLDKECFAKADAALVEWLGFRHVGIALQGPPLRPLPKALATLETDGAASSVVYAQRAGVAIASRGSKTQVFDIGSGESIVQRDRTASGALSANGRVYGTSEGDSLQLRDTESDALLLTFDDVKARSFRFLGDVGAVIFVANREDGKRRLEYVDFRKGRRVPVAIDEYLDDDILALPGDGTRFLASNHAQFIELQVVDGADGAHIEVRRKVQIAGRRHAGRMFLTVDGKWLPSVGVDRIELLNIASMTSRSILLSPLRPVDVVPTRDPDKLVVTVGVPGDYNPQSYLYSIAARTLAPIDKSRAWSRITWLPMLKRNAMVDNARLVPMDTIPIGEAEDASLVIERAMAAAAQASADAAKRQAERAAAFASVGNDPTTLARHDAIERMIRENNVAAPEAARLRQWAATIAAKSGQRAAVASAPTANSGGTLGVPANADVRAVGVYEAADGSHGVGKASKPGSVRVFVSRSSRPIVLVLSSYEPVNWILQLQPGAKVSNVLLSSYHSSQAFGAKDARIDSIGTQHAYKRGSPDFEALDAQVRSLTGKRIGSFQGAYSGTSFSLGR